MLFKKIHFILFFTFILIANIYTQVNDISFNVQSTFDPIIKASNKLTDNPEVIDTIRKITKFNYNIQSYPTYKKYEIEPLTFAKYKEKNIWNANRSFIKGGYGFMYNMPLLELYFGNKNDKDLRYGINYNLLGSNSQLKDVGYSGFLDQYASAFAEKLIEKHLVNFKLDYSNNKMYQYGFDTSVTKLNDKNQYRQQYYYWSPSINIKSRYTDSSKIQHDVTLSFYNLQNYYDVRENNIKIKTDLSTFIHEENFHLDLQYDFYNHKLKSDTINNHIFNLSPYFLAKNENYEIKIGLKATIDAFYTNKFHFYPIFFVNYNIFQHIIEGFAGVDGQLQKNSVKSLSDENPFIQNNIHLTNSNQAYNIFAGLKGRLSSSTSYFIKGTYEKWDSLYFFNINYYNTVQINNQFLVNYDNTNLITVSGQIKHDINSKLFVFASGTYFNYQTKNFNKPYHKPLYRAQASANYILNNQLSFKGDVFIIGEQWAHQPSSDKLLKGIVDMNFMAQYHRSKKFSVFLMFNNIANVRYYRWDRYPTQRFNIMLGLTFIPF